MSVLYHSIVIFVRNTGKAFFGLTVEGLEHVPSQGKVLIAANHQSYLDPPLLGSVLPREINYLAKVELFRNPLFGALLRHLNCIPINRSGQDMESLRRAIRVLDSGGALLVFPEGTRSRRGDFLRPTRGLGLLAKQSGAPVVPAYIHGTRGFWRRLFRPGGLRVVFGEPLHFSAFNVEQLKGGDRYQAFSDEVMQIIAALKAARP
ncbi:MAG TPA: lysophospholipid acyltransferase family protein [bacterium]|jgi:1-acyl-sn-glycerol-3-phosphate acyltransferase